MQNRFRGFVSFAKFCSTLFLIFVIHLGCNAEMSKGEPSPRAKGWLGISIQDITPSLKKALKLDSKRGVLVNHVAQDSPADDAGMEEGDIVLKLDGKNIDDSDDLVRKVRKMKPGEEIDVLVLRSGDEKKIEVVVGRRPRDSDWYGFELGDEPGHAFRMFTSFSGGVLGMELQDMNEQLGEFLKAPNGEGVFVTNVEEDSPASDAGIKAGDVIVSVAGRDVDGTESLMDEFEDFDEGDNFQVTVLRNGSKKNMSVEADGSVVHSPRIRINKRIRTKPGSFKHKMPRLRGFDGEDGEFRFRFYDDDELDELRDELKELRDEINKLKNRS